MVSLVFAEKLGTPQTPPCTPRYIIGGNNVVLWRLDRHYSSVRPLCQWEAKSWEGLDLRRPRRGHRTLHGVVRRPYIAGKLRAASLDLPAIMLINSFEGGESGSMK